MYVLIHGRNHKYIAKIKRPTGRYRYFYSKDEYEAYLNRKKDIDRIINDLKRDNNSINDQEQERLEDFFEKIMSSTEFFIGTNSSEVSNLISAHSSDKVSDINKDHKYIAKVPMKNGRYRYFYSSKEYEAYLKQAAYQEDEPDFMKDIPETNTYYTADQDMRSVNPEYMSSIAEIFTFNEDTKTEDIRSYAWNCSLCTATYELRRRGYDVTAAPMTIAQAEKMASLNKDGGTYSDAFYKDPVVNKIENPSDLEKSLSSVPNSRGDLSFKWKGQTTGHSIAYETDDKGNVTLRDCQSNKKYSTSEEISKYSNRIESIQYIRTDNLEFDEKVMDGVFEVNKKRNK